MQFFTLFRRPLLAAALALVVLVGFLAAPADAHLCTRPVGVEPGKPASFTVGVPAENVPVVGVTVRIPDGFAVDRIEGAAGWRTRRTGDVVRFTGGRIGLVSCASFRFHGTASERRTYAFPLTIEKTDGTAEELTFTEIGPSSAQLVFAGTPIPDYERGESRSIPWKPVGAGVAAALYGGVLWWSRRRRRAQEASRRAARRHAPKRKPRRR